VGQLGGVYRERLQLAEDVGEPQPDEPDVALLDERPHIVLGERGSGRRHRAANVTCLPKGGWRGCAKGGLRGCARRATGWPSAVSPPVPARVHAPSGRARTRPSAAGPRSPFARPSRAARAPSSARTGAGPTAPAPPVRSRRSAARPPSGPRGSRPSSAGRPAPPPRGTADSNRSSEGRRDQTRPCPRAHPCVSELTLLATRATHH